MRILVMTDIEGVTGVTTFPQAENSEFGRSMLMNDLQAVLSGIRDAGAEAVVYDMHTDGRNVSLSDVDVPVVMGKPINSGLYRSVGSAVDALFLVGLHTMQHTGALLAHSYLREYDAIYINNTLMGEIGVEAALAGEQGIPLLFVSGDDKGCEEAAALIPGITTCAVKKSLGPEAALCQQPCVTGPLLRRAAKAAAQSALPPFRLAPPYAIRIEYSQCRYLSVMKHLHPEIFTGDHVVTMHGDSLLKVWSQYLLLEKEMVNA